MSATNRIWLLAVAIVIIGVMALGWFVGVSPRLAEVAAANEQRAQVEQTNAQYERQLAQLKKDAEGIDDLRAQLAAIGLKLPAEVGDADLMRVMEQFASSSGVTLDSITWADPRFIGSEGGDGDTSTGLAPAGSFIGLPVVVEYTGSYTAVQEFIRQVQNVSTRHMLVASFSSSASAGVDSFSVSLALVLFVIVGEPEDEADADGDAAEETEEAPAPEPSESPEPTETGTPEGEESPAPTSSATP